LGRNGPEGTGSGKDDDGFISYSSHTIGWISPQTGYKIQGSISTKKLNHIVKTKIGDLKATVTSKMTLYNQIKT